MLKPAILYSDHLQARYIEAVINDRLKFFYRTPIVDYLLPIYYAGEMIQYVSLEGEKVIGYMAWRVDRETDIAYDLQIINFEGKNDVFTADLYDLMQFIFQKHGARKVKWWVIIGNPAEKFYDRVVDNFGGQIVGIFTDDAKLPDGRLYSVKHYEIMRDSFNDALINTGVTWNDYREYKRGCN